MSRHRAQAGNGFWGRLVRAGLWVMLSMLAGLLAICIGLYFSLRPFG